LSGSPRCVWSAKAPAEARYLAVARTTNEHDPSAAPPNDDRFFIALAIRFQGVAEQHVAALDRKTIESLLRDPHLLVAEVGQRATARFKHTAASAPRLWRRIYDAWHAAPAGTQGPRELTAMVLAQAISIVLDKSVTLDDTLDQRIGGETISGIGRRQPIL
jgi:DNA gyrase inhibitor GyrI